MADAAASAQPRLAGHDGAHQLVGVQAALHEGVGLAAPHKGDGLFSGVMAVRCIDAAETGEIDAYGSGRRRELSGRRHEDRLHEVEFGGLDRRAERDGVAGMGDGDAEPRQRLRRRDQPVIFRMAQGRVVVTHDPVPQRFM